MSEEEGVGGVVDLAEPAPAVNNPVAGLRDPRAKLKHIEACLTQPVEYEKRTGLETFDLINQALPEVSLAHLDLTASLAGKTLRAPLMIAPMTGGTEEGLAINL